MMNHETQSDYDPGPPSSDEITNTTSQLDVATAPATSTPMSTSAIFVDTAVVSFDSPPGSFQSLVAQQRADGTAVELVPPAPNPDLPPATALPDRQVERGWDGKAWDQRHWSDDPFNINDRNEQAAREKAEF